MTSHVIRVTPEARGIGRLRPVDLTQGEVDAFMEADKTVPAASPLVWEHPSPTKVLWRAPVEVDSVQQGSVTLYVNPTFARRWTFKLSLHREEVYRLDVKPFVSHSNPPERPEQCPSKVTTPEHEHRWHEGLGLRCAYPLEDLSSASHRRILGVFCERARINFEPEYSDPVEGIQLEIYGD